jgi:Amt family ammonium transporter
VTPCAGFVNVTDAAIIGVIAAAVCYWAVSLKNRLGWDDALDVWGVHGVGGVIGTIMLGIFATQAVNPDGPSGLLAGNSSLLVKQTVAVLGASAYAFAFTYVMLVLINKVTTVRCSEEDERAGLDVALHGESAYELD